MQASRFLRILAVLFSLALLGTACGGDDDDVATDDADAPIDSGADDSGGSDAGGDSSSDEPSDSGDIAGLFQGNCREAITAFAAVQSSFAGAFGGALGDDAIGDAADALDELAGEAPDEIKEAFEVYAEELGAYFEALGDVDLSSLAAGGQPDPATIAALTTASESVDEEALEAASEEIGSYFEGTCAG